MKKLSVASDNGRLAAPFIYVWDPTYAAGNRPGILIVLEDPLVRNVLGAAFLGKGHFVLTAADSSEAMNLAEVFGGQLQVVIGADGSAGLREVATALGGDGRSLRIILISSTTCAEFAASARRIDCEYPVPQSVAEAVQEAVTGAEPFESPRVV